MGGKAASGDRSLTNTGVARRIETLVKKLVSKAREADSAHPPEAPVDCEREGERILFDCEVDGVRCVLAQAAEGLADTLSLSPREQEIARMIAKGYPNKAIAAVLEISIWTVSTHLRRVFAKLGVSSRAAMVAKLIEKRML